MENSIAGHHLSRGGVACDVTAVSVIDACWWARDRDRPELSPDNYSFKI